MKKQEFVSFETLFALKFYLVSFWLFARFFLPQFLLGEKVRVSLSTVHLYIKLFVPQCVSGLLCQWLLVVRLSPGQLTFS